MPIWSSGWHIPTQKIPKCPPPQDLAPAVQKVDNTIHQAPVVQTLDSAIHRINHYPAPHKYNLGETDCTIHRIEIYLEDSAIQPLKNRGQINYYPLDSTIGFPKTYPLDSDLSSGLLYLTFEQLGPDVCGIQTILLFFAAISSSLMSLFQGHVVCWNFTLTGPY